MKIAHISDVHIRPLKYHAEYRRVFGNFYQKLRELGVDLVVNTGDTHHSKTNISPEYVSLVSEFLLSIADVCPVVNVLGNHDLNLMNQAREDALSPVIDALKNPNIELWKKSGLWVLGGEGEWKDKLAFWNFGITDPGKWPTGPYPEDKINIGLFHGSIRNCVTDSNFRMTNVEYDEDIFRGLDYVMMGDIHKRQWFNNKRAWYAGSMIQQNFGEELEKGFLLWDIRGKDDFEVTFHELRGSRKFYTLKIPQDLRVPDMEIEAGSRIRLSPPRPLTLVEQRTIEKLAKRKYAPHDVITLAANNSGQMQVQAAGTTKIENLRDLSVQEQLLRDYLGARQVPQSAVDKIIALNRKYQTEVEQKEDMARGVNWRILKMGWNNLYNYGDGNVIDFSQIRGLTGIFAPNASGKTSMIDAITVGMFDSNTKEVSKNIHLVNDNKDNAVVILELLANGERFTVQREIERIKYGTKTGESKEWGKTKLDFVRHDRDGGTESLVMESRPDTEKQIRRRFGSFDDFMLTALFAQWDPMDLIMCKETDRKRILFRFLDLDIFEEKAKLAKEEAKEWLERLADLEEGGYEDAARECREAIERTRASVQSISQEVSSREEKRRALQERIEELLQEKSSVPQLGWKMDEQRRVLEESTRRIDRTLVELSKRNEALRELQSQYHEHLEKNVGRDKIELEEYEKLRDEARENVARIESELREHGLHVRARERQLEILGKVPCGDKFPGCQFLVDAFEARETIGQHRQEVAELEDELRTSVEELEKWELKVSRASARVEVGRKMGDVRSSIESAKLRVEKLQAEVDSEEMFKRQAEERIAAIEKVASDVSKNERLDAEISGVRASLRTTERELSSLRDDLSEQNRKLGSDQGVLERIEAALAKLQEVKETCTAYEHFLSAMGKDGIALQVLTQKLPVINEEINKILGTAAEFSVHIEYDQDDQSIRLYIQYGEYKSRLLELGSGAEKFLASVAIRAALLSISNLPRSNMFIIDEGFGKLDPQNIESIQRMFDYLKSVFDHVIVISHNDVMKDLVDNMIDIVADEEGYAHVSVGG